MRPSPSRGPLSVFTRLAAPLLAALALSGPAASAPPPPPEATTAAVAKGAGCVREAPGSTCRAASAEMTTGPQGAFVAGAEGATLRLHDGSILELDPEAEVRFLQTQAVQVPAKVKAPVVQLLQGRARCTLSPVTTPPKAVVVRGPGTLVGIVAAGTTAFRAAPDRLAVSVRSGRTITSGAENDWLELKPGRARTLLRTGKAPVRAALVAPAVTADPSFGVVSTPPSAPPMLKWKAVPGAEGYEVALRPLGSVRPTWTRRTGATTLSLALTEVPAGAYEAVVRAVDAEELDEAWSTPAPVNFITLDLPPGAVYVSENNIQIPEGQKLGLRHVHGLESTLNESTSFAPAANEARLMTDRPQTLRLRRPGTTREFAVRLEPRTFHIDVDIGPKRARWPGDTITVVVRPLNRDGSPLPSTLKLTPKVTLNTDPITVTWVQDGPTMRASIPPRPTGVPNVLRVEVIDQYGYVLGRNFLEIADRNTPLRW
ncbi:MAG TPA: hypothetical protein VFS43_45965 [Polyangiaceae bacterium]|nr:hypothetical protein [Polyangiaceae bacterium]